MEKVKGAGEVDFVFLNLNNEVGTVYGDHQRFIDTYFSQFDGKYFILIV